MVRSHPFFGFLRLTVWLISGSAGVGYGGTLESQISNMSPEEFQEFLFKEKKAKDEAEKVLREKRRLFPGDKSGLSPMGRNIKRMGGEKALKGRQIFSDRPPADPREESGVLSPLGDSERASPPGGLAIMGRASAPPLTEEEIADVVRYDKSIKLHTSALLNLKAGDSRGEITYPLYHGTIRGSNNHVSFVLSEASDREFAEEFGIMHSRNLASVNQAGIEEGATLSNDGWKFSQDPGLVSHMDESGTLQGATKNPDSDYSPLKRLTWGDRKIIINAPFVKWGNDPGQMLIVDQGGCDPNIRGNPPPEPISGPGPAGCKEGEKPLARYRGGQVIKIDIPVGCPAEDPRTPCGSVTMKLHRAIYRPGIYPYVTIFDASKAATAEQLGIPFAPKLARGWSANDAIASLVEFQNGVRSNNGGPARFQSGLTSYGSQRWSNYSPIAEVTWASFDCNGNQKMDDENTECEAYAVSLTRPGLGYFPKGLVFSEDLQDLIDYGAVYVTAAPAGLSGEKVQDETGLKGLLLVNAPSPVTARPQ